MAKELEVVIHVRKKGEEDRLWNDLTEEEKKECSRHITDNFMKALGYAKVTEDKTA